MLLTLILASFVTLFVIIRMWIEIFWKESPKPLTEEMDHFAPMPKSGKFALIAPIVFLTVVSLFIGFGANSIFKISEKAAYELKHKEIYIDAVMKTNT